MLAQTYQRNVAQQGDALDLSRSLPDACAAAASFDPQHRGVFDYMKLGNEAARQHGRAALPSMTDEYIEQVARDLARALKPSGHLFFWADTFNLCEAFHLRFADVLKPVDLIAWDSLRMGMGKRSRRRGDYLLALQRPPIVAKNWTDHGIPSRWPERVDRTIHPHLKPIGLIRRLIEAVTEPGDLVIDPCAGSFVVMVAARDLGREFMGCDIAFNGSVIAPAQLPKLNLGAQRRRSRPDAGQLEIQFPEARCSAARTDAAESSDPSAARESDRSPATDAASAQTHATCGQLSTLAPDPLDIPDFLRRTV